MGSYVAYHYLNSLFDYGVTSVINKSFSDLRYEITYNKSLYIIVAKSVFLSRSDIESMMNYVSNGNTLFISADYIDRRLTDTLMAKPTFDFMSFFALNEYQLPKKRYMAFACPGISTGSEEVWIFLCSLWRQVYLLR